MYSLLRPLLFRLDAETAHDTVTRAAAVAGRVPGVPALLRLAAGRQDERLRQCVWGLEFPNPVGLAAGLDKDGRLLHVLPALGFGFLEAGAVTPRPQPGNPRPRLSRLTRDEALINRMGFNNDGAEALRARIAALRSRPVPIGVNIGKNRGTPLEHAAEDYRAVLAVVHPVADFAVLNVSSPNTPGLRDLQQAAGLAALLGELAADRTRLAARDGRRVPMLIKVSPDLAAGEFEAIAQAALRHGVDGIVATNTSTGRAGLRSPGAAESGGLSGRPIHAAALRAVGSLHRLTGGRLPIVGVGGIFSAEDAYAFIRAGATLVQVYTGLVYRGPGLVRELRLGLARLLSRDGFPNVAAAIGSVHR